SPLAEAGAEVVVLLEAGAEPVEALGDKLTLSARERHGADVDLDPGDDALVLEDFHQGSAVCGILADCLVVEDDAADELACAFGPEEQLAVVAAVGLGAFDADRVEAALDRAGTLVRGEDTLARR